MESKKSSKKDKKELKKELPKLEEKASIWDIAIMIYWILMALIMVYLFYLTFTYQV